MKKFYSLVAAALLLPASALAQDFDLSGVSQLFEHDLAAKFGVTDASTIHPTLAKCGTDIVLNLGDGSAPIYLGAASGEKIGDITLGEANPSGCVVSDCKGNMLIMNYAESGSTLKVYKLSAPSETPSLFFTWDNACGLPVGHQAQVQGDLNGTASIIATLEGIPQVVGSSHIVRWEVSNGTVGEPEIIEITGIHTWMTIDNSAKVAAKSTNKADGYFLAHYDGGANNFYHIDGTSNTVDATVSPIGSGAEWGQVYNCCDSRDFGGYNFTVLFIQGYWPSWGLPGSLHLFNTTTLNGFTGNVTDAEIGNVSISDFETISYPGDNRCGDVFLDATDTSLAVYYVSNTHLGIGGVSLYGEVNGIDTPNAVAAKGFRAYGAKGAIVVENNGATVEVYNAAGAAVARTNNSEINVAPGLYIVKVAGNTQKVLVK